MKKIISPIPDQVIALMVDAALAEDIGHGDITAALVPSMHMATATVITREAMCLCGLAWFTRVFTQIDSTITIHWCYEDGDEVAAGATLCTLSGPARALLSGERAALNFLQLLCGTATVTRRYVQLLIGSHTRLLDTRKTIPGFRLAQKYAVRCGGGTNHRFGLYDAFLIKENHIAAAGSIGAAVIAARHYAPGKSIEVEVESLPQLDEAIAYQADIVLLDNFSVLDVEIAVRRAAGQVQLEVSGNVSAEQLQQLAALGVDYISVGALTKHIQAIDLSMRIVSV
ncbi:MAG: carboxylating nicotinate-nucleotide diphosphorylase [Ottowia sp.]|nr:carboxylating nicotinate-nucleotide diphosphorylase [Ottowia sp.]